MEIQKANEPIWNGSFSTQYGTQQIKAYTLNSTRSAFLDSVRQEISKSLAAIQIKDFDKECDFFEDDMVLKPKQKNEMAFIKFEPTSNTNMYNQVFKRLFLINQQSPKRYISLDLGGCRVAKKFYLITYTAKNGEVDARLKNMFSIELKRDRDYIIGVLVGENVDVGKITKEYVHPIPKVENENDSNTDLYQKFIQLIRNSSLYETLYCLLANCVQDEIYSNKEQRNGIIEFLSGLKEIKLLTRSEKLKLKETFGKDLPEFIAILMKSNEDIVQVYDIPRASKTTANNFEQKPKVEKRVNPVEEEEEWILDDREFYRRKEIEKAKKKLEICISDDEESNSDRSSPESQKSNTSKGRLQGFDDESWARQEYKKNHIRDYQRVHGSYESIASEESEKYESLHRKKRFDFHGNQRYSSYDRDVSYCRNSKDHYGKFNKTVHHKPY